MTRSVLVCALALLLGAREGRAQEFADAAPTGERSLAALLERGLPAPASGLGATALATRWHGLAEIQTRSLAIGAGIRSLQIAAGVSQTGDAELGWSQLGVAAGAASERGGVAFRGALRRRDGLATAREGIGGEVGAGAWVGAAPGFVVWTTAPQLWTRGDPPPLERWLEIGARLEWEEAQLWLARAAAPGAPRGLRAEHLAGLRVPAGTAAVWIEARDHPARGTLGVAVTVSELRVSAAVEGHPVLGETVRLTLSWNGGSS